MTDMPDAMDRWCVALEQGDNDEIDRLVMKNHAERSAFALSGALGQMVGGVDRRRPHGDGSVHE